MPADVPPSRFLDCRGRTLDLSRPAAMGVLNVTPDSFSDGGLHPTVSSAVDHALRMVGEGAAIIDVGGESTRPGARPVGAAEERARVEPVVRALRGIDAVISVDTMRREVMEAALDAGAHMVNDVNGLRGEGVLDLVARSGCGLCVMHMLGTPADMADDPRYGDVVAEILGFLRGRLSALRDAGVAEDRVCVDPGFGFGKTLGHNCELLGRLGDFLGLGRPVLVGLSRKSMLGGITGRGVEGRLSAGIAAATIALANGADIVRTHDVAETVDAVRVFSRVPRPGGEPARPGAAL